MTLTVHPLADGSQNFNLILGALDTPAWHDIGMHGLMWHYYDSIEASPYTNLSLAAYDDKDLIAVALANVTNGVLGYFSQPISIAQRTDRPVPAEATELLVKSFVDILKKKNLDVLSVSGPLLGDGTIPPWALALLNSGAVYRPSFDGEILLGGGEEQLRGGLRKSYRSLINSGRRDLHIVIIDKDAQDRAAFDTFRLFHKKIAGRETRPLASWDQMYSLLCSGKAELIIGYLGEDMVSCTFIFYSTDTALYGTGVYERALFEKPIAHWPLYLAILRAQQRGNKIFRLGSVYLDQAHDAKERNIAYFKKGFTSRVMLRGHWTIKSSPEARIR